MEPDKEYTCHCLLFCFHQKKSVTDSHRITCEIYDENVMSLEYVRIDFKKQFKNDISYKECSGHPLAVEKTNCEKRN